MSGHLQALQHILLALLLFPGEFRCQELWVRGGAISGEAVMPMPAQLLPNGPRLLALPLLPLDMASAQGLDARKRYHIPLHFHLIVPQDTRFNVTPEVVGAQMDVLNRDFGAGPITFRLASLNTLSPSDANYQAWAGDCYRHRASIVGALVRQPTTALTVVVCQLPDRTNFWHSGLSAPRKAFAFPMTYPGCRAASLDDPYSDQHSDIKAVTFIDHRTLPGGPDEGYNHGHGLSHELGHQLGLAHHTSPHNFMGPGNDEAVREFTAQQWDLMVRVLQECRPIMAHTSAAPGRDPPASLAAL